MMNSNIIRTCITVLLFVFCLAGFTSAKQHHRITSEDSKGIVKLINPAVTGSLMMMEIPVCLDVLGGYAYVLTDKSLNVVDVEPVSEINLISTTATCANPIGVAVIADYAYVLCPGKGIQMFNISDKTKPVLKNTLGGLNPVDCTVIDNTLFVVSRDDDSGTGWHNSINALEPDRQSVKQLFSVDGRILAFDCDSKGIYALCEMKSDSADGLNLVAFNFDAGKLKIMGALESISADVNSAMIDGNILYAVDSSFGIFAYNVEGGTPKLLSKLKLKGTPCDIDIYSDAAFVCCQSGGLIIVDISDPSNMKINNKAVTPGKILDAVAGGKLVYTVDDYGVQIVKLLD